jgi:PTH1 family peptidyl-tRNA hydrolase
VYGDQDDRTRFVVGLGNPGRKYERTRHNLGFRVLDELQRRWDADGPRQAFDGLVWNARPGARVVLLAPQTYMNCSGRSVAQMVRFYKADVEDVLVVLDDIALAPGQIRVRAGGSAGGHNGLTDVLASLATDQVPRLRIGIGQPGRMDQVDFVLSRFSADEEPAVESAIAAAADAVEDWVLHGIRCVMDKYNRRIGQQEP